MVGAATAAAMMDLILRGLAGICGVAFAKQSEAAASDCLV
jgi:hypothetical protein